MRVIHTQGKAAGTAEASFLAFHLPKFSEENASPDDLEDLKEAAATIYEAGTETVSASEIRFLLGSLKPLSRHGRHSACFYLRWFSAQNARNEPAKK